MKNIASIGAGGRGEIVRLAHRPDQGYALSLVCDLKPDVLSAYQQDFGEGIATTSNWRDILTNPRIDMVFLTTPDYLHAEQCVALLEAGKTVYLEKPMGITVAECDAILSAARKNGDRLFVGHNMRFSPVFREMKRLIDDGVIGQVEAIWVRHFIDYGGDAYFKDWHSERSRVTGLLLQKGAHDIDIIHWLGGSFSERTVAMGKLSVYDRVASRRPREQPGDATFSEDNWPPLSQTQLSPTIDVEDHSMLLMQLRNGVQASYQQCHYTPDGCRNYTVIGTEGRLENTGDFSVEGHAATIRIWTKRCGMRRDQCETIEFPYAEGGHGGADEKIVDAFLEFYETSSNPTGVAPVAARMSVAVGVAATQSLRENNRPIDIPPVAFEDSCFGRNSVSAP